MTDDTDTELPPVLWTDLVTDDERREIVSEVLWE